MAASSDFSAQVLDLGPEAIDRLEVERLRRVLSAKEPGSDLLGLSDVELLVRLGLLVAAPSLRPTVAGLLFVGTGEAIRRAVPGHEAIYLHMRNQTEYDRRVDSHSPLLALLEQFSQAIEPHNRIFRLKLGMFHFEIPDFPQEVYREALLNALVHRDYGRNNPVYLRQFPDRIEVSSPGGFFGGVTAENVLGHEPVTRNRLLAEVLQRLRLVERAGVGVKRMFHIMLSFGKEPPSYEATSDFVRVILRSGRTEAGTTVDETFARFVADEQKEGRELGLYDLLVLTFLKRNREIDQAEAQRILQRGENEAREVLNSMAVRGLLEPFGQKKGRVYRLSKKVYASLRQSVGYQIFRRAETAYAENTILTYLDEMPEDKRFVTNEIVRTLLRVSPHQAGYILANLVKKGQLVLRGRSRSAKYYKTNQLSAF
ncbi:MAG: ATP-binding protein [candidate division WOR-3 bacterium]